jgi:hypothetical protein
MRTREERRGNAFRYVDENWFYGPLVGWLGLARAWIARTCRPVLEWGHRMSHLLTVSDKRPGGTTRRPQNLTRWHRCPGTPPITRPHNLPVLGVSDRHVWTGTPYQSQTSRLPVHGTSTDESHRPSMAGTVRPYLSRLRQRSSPVPRSDRGPFGTMGRQSPPPRQRTQGSVSELQRPQSTHRLTLHPPQPSPATTPRPSRPPFGSQQNKYPHPPRHPTRRANATAGGAQVPGHPPIQGPAYNLAFFCIPPPQRSTQASLAVSAKLRAPTTLMVYGIRGGWRGSGTVLGRSLGTLSA